MSDQLQLPRSRPRPYGAPAHAAVARAADGREVRIPSRRLRNASDERLVAGVRCVEDGVGGARSDLSPAPSVDIANNAPSGAGATNRMVISWVDGQAGLDHEHVMFSRSSNGGANWTSPAAVERVGDRGYYSAPAISPDGQDVYLTYNAFRTPFRTSAVGAGNDRQLVGVVLHADWAGAFSELHRGQTGDARGSSQNDLAAEFLGDYVYAAASNDYGAAVWNDMRAGADCDAVDRYRQALHDEAVATGQQTA